MDIITYKEFLWTMDIKTYYGYFWIHVDLWNFEQKSLVGNDFSGELTWQLEGKFPFEHDRFPISCVCLLERDQVLDKTWMKHRNLHSCLSSGGGFFYFNTIFFQNTVFLGSKTSNSQVKINQPAGRFEKWTALCCAYEAAASETSCLARWVTGDMVGDTQVILHVRVAWKVSLSLSYWYKYIHKIIFVCKVYDFRGLKPGI